MVVSCLLCLSVIHMTSMRNLSTPPFYDKCLILEFQMCFGVFLILLFPTQKKTMFGFEWVKFWQFISMLFCINWQKSVSPIQSMYVDVKHKVQGPESARQRNQTDPLNGSEKSTFYSFSKWQNSSMAMATIKWLINKQLNDRKFLVLHYLL